MNILVVNPPNKPFTNLGLLAEPIDVLQIATIIKEKYEKVKVIDMDVLSMKNNINDYLENDSNIIVFVYDYQIPLHTSQAIDNIFEIIKNYENKNCKTIMIGKTSTYYDEYFLSNNVDVVIKGKAEAVINDIILAFDINDSLKTIDGISYKEKGRVVRNKFGKVVDYGNLPIPDRSLVDISKYINTRTMITSRGCSGKCAFCTTPFYFGSWEAKPYEKVVEEIEYLVNEYKTKQILFLDDNATVDKKRMMNICEEIKRRDIKVTFGCLSSIRHYDKELFALMYEVGFRWVHFGLESGSKDVLKKMNKLMDLEYVRNVVKECKKIGYRIRTSWILDYLGSTLNDLEKTVQFILELETDEIRLHFLCLRVGTELFKKEDSVNEQYIHKNALSVINKPAKTKIEGLLNKLNRKGYVVIDKEIDWNTYKDKKNIKMVSLVPMRYGVDWNEKSNRSNRNYGEWQIYPVQNSS